MPDLSIKWPVENGPTAQTKKQKLHAYVASLAFHTTPFQMHSEPTNPATSSGQQNGIFRKVGIQVRLTGQKLCILAWDEEQEISLGRLKKKKIVLLLHAVHSGIQSETHGWTLSSLSEMDYKTSHYPKYCPAVSPSAVARQSAEPWASKTRKFMQVSNTLCNDLFVFLFFFASQPCCLTFHCFQVRGSLRYG